VEILFADVCWLISLKKKSIIAACAFKKWRAM
jgi:hypothetical protein